jgi:hypothetical protein
MGRRFNLRYHYAENVGRMLEAGLPVAGRCGVCAEQRDVDLARLHAAKGPDYSLWHRRTRCTLTPDCPGWITFRHWGSQWLAHMYDDDDIARWMATDQQR